MRVLLYSYTFLPSIGGIEVVSATLAENIIKLGHECIVVTETVSAEKDTGIYRVERAPSFEKRFSLVKWADVVHSNGASLALFFYAKLLSKPFIWTHGGYQVKCIDGLGWVNGEKAPIDTWGSIKFHFNRNGFFFTAKESLKLLIRQLTAQVVDKNVAITHWVANRQPLRNQEIIYNPFPLERFAKLRDDISKEFDFIFVGRIVSEKGVSTLLKAFQLLVRDENFSNKKLAIVGDGDWKEKMVKLSKELTISEKVLFFGRKTGRALEEIIEKSQIAIIPSEWEEPMGGVALELLAASKNIIVSRNGGLAECVGEAGLKFNNGSYLELFECMKELSENEILRNRQKVFAKVQLNKFNPIELTNQYINLYKNLLEK